MPAFFSSILVLDVFALKFHKFLERPETFTISSCTSGMNVTSSSDSRHGVNYGAWTKITKISKFEKLLQKLRSEPSLEMAKWE